MADREITVETLPGITKLRMGGEWFIAVNLGDMDPEAWLEGEEEDTYEQEWRDQTFLPVWLLAKLVRMPVDYVVWALEDHAYNQAIRDNESPWDYEVGGYVSATEFEGNSYIARYWLTRPEPTSSESPVRHVDNTDDPTPMVLFLPMPNEHHDDFDDIIREAWWKNAIARHKVHDVEPTLEKLEEALKPIEGQIRFMERYLKHWKAREALGTIRRLEVLASLMRFTTTRPDGQLMHIFDLQRELGQLNRAAGDSLVSWYLEWSPHAKKRDALAKKVVKILRTASDLADGIVDMWMHEAETPEYLWDRVVSVLDRTVETLLKTKQAKHLLEEFLEPVFRGIAQLAAVNVDGTTLAGQIASFSGEGFQEKGATTNVFERVVNVSKWTKRGRSALVIWANMCSPHLLAKLSPAVGKPDPRFASWVFRLLTESASLEDDLQQDLLRILEKDDKYIPGLLKKLDTGGVDSSLLFKKAWLAWGAIANVAKLIHAIGSSETATLKRWQAIIEGTLGLAEAGVEGTLALAEARAALFHLRVAKSTQTSLKSAGKALGVAGALVGMGFSYWALGRAVHSGNRRKMAEERVNFVLAAAAGIAAVGGAPVALGVLLVTLGWELGLWIRGMLDEETEKYFRGALEAFEDYPWVRVRSIDDDTTLNPRTFKGHGKGMKTYVPDAWTFALRKEIKDTWGVISHKGFEFWPLWDGKSKKHRDYMKNKLKENGFDEEAIKKLLEPDD